MSNENKEPISIRDMIEMHLKTMSTDIQDTEDKITKAKPGTPEHAALVVRHEKLSNKWDSFFARYKELYIDDPKEAMKTKLDYEVALYRAQKEIDREFETTEKWYRRTDWGRNMLTGFQIAAAAIQSWAVFKVQRDGYLIKNDIVRIQMPKG